MLISELKFSNSELVNRDPRTAVFYLVISARLDDARAAANHILARESHKMQTIRASSLSGSPALNLQNSIPQSQVGGGGIMGTHTLKNETVSKKAFALQDKVISNFFSFYKIIDEQCLLLPTCSGSKHDQWMKMGWARFVAPAR